jgi:isocitrate dehydrogenase
MMLRYLGEFEKAELIENALLATLEEGKVLTGDVVGYDRGASTTEYTDAIIANLGKKPQTTSVRSYKPLQLPKVSPELALVVPKQRRCIGVDVFVESTQLPEQLGPALESLLDGLPLRLKMISNRGTRVYPPTGAMPEYVDHYRCRFLLRDGAGELDDAAILELLQRIGGRYRWMHVEKLQEFDGAQGFTKAQGED